MLIVLYCTLNQNTISSTLCHRPIDLILLPLACTRIHPIGSQTEFRTPTVVPQTTARRSTHLRDGTGVSLGKHILPYHLGPNTGHILSFAPTSALSQVRTYGVLYILSRGQIPQIEPQRSRPCGLALTPELELKGAQSFVTMPGSSPAYGILACPDPARHHPCLSSSVHHLKLPSLDAQPTLGLIPVRLGLLQRVLTMRSNFRPTQGHSWLQRPPVDVIVSHVIARHLTGRPAQDHLRQYCTL